MNAARRALSLSLLIVTACGGEPPRAVVGLSVQHVAPPDVEAPLVQPLYRAATHEVPLPNDLYRGSLVLAVPAALARTDAEADLYARLSGASGYWASSAVSFPLSGPLDETTTDDLSLFFNPDTQAVVAHTMVLHDDAVVLVPDAPLNPGQRYVAALFAGATGRFGAPVVRDDEYAAYAEGRGTDYEQAAQHDVTEALTAIQNRGLDPNEVVVSTLFSVTEDDAYPFDAATLTVPFPSTFHLGQDGIQVPGASFAAGFADVLGTYGGFSTQGPVMFPFPDEVNNNAALHNAMSLFVVDDTGLSPVLDTITATFDDDFSTIAPERALAPAQDVAAFLIRGPSAGGRTFAPGLSVLAVTSPHPLVDETGRSTVRLLADATAQTLEPAREAFAEAALYAADHGIARDDLLTLTRFPLLDAKTRVQAMRAALYDGQIDPQPHDVVVATPEERGLPFILSDIDTVVTGTLTTLDFLAGDSAAGGLESTETPIEFILTVPDGYEDGSPMPVVLFGHGLFTTRELVYLAADFLAAAGFAALCVDLPFHGKRAVCAGSGDCADGAMCEADGVCRQGDGTEAALVTVQSPVPGGPAVPLSTGAKFIDLDQPANTRDNFLQGLVDLSQAVRAIQVGDWPGLTGGYALDGNDIVYLGMSLGGIYGASFSALEDNIDDFALNVPGAGLVDLMQESVALRDDIQDFAGQTGTLPGTDAYFAYVYAARWILDLSDPQNLVRPHPEKRYLIQMANGDEMVSNAATGRLADALGEPIEEFFPLLSGHAFMFDPTSLEGQAARDQIVSFFEARHDPP